MTGRFRYYSPSLRKFCIFWINWFVVSTLTHHFCEHIISYVFSCASAKAERSLSSLSCLWMYVDQNKGTPSSGNGISTGNSLISSLDLDSPQKINLEWYLFLKGSLQITLLQIYFWYDKTIWDHFKHGGILLLQTTANHSANQNAGTTKNPATY